jgi:hypothetical protein
MSIGYGCWGLSLKGMGNELGFLLKFFHLDIEYHVAWDLLIPNRCNITVRKDLEGNADLLHSLYSRIGPVGVVIPAV